MRISLANTLFLSFICILNGCICDCFDECKRDFFIQLDQNSFDSSALSFITLKQRSVENDSLTGLWESPLQEDSTYILMGPCFNGIDKFAITLDGTTNAFYYELILKDSDTFVLDNLIVTGDRQGNIACKCFDLESKSLNVNGVQIDALEGIILK